ncbi:MAG: ATP-dependent helicase [Microgenomates group bacterium]
MLNEEQKKAVEYNSGPLLIVAGAGTGKTTVIVEKIKYLLKKNLAKPEEILALTFTEKAAYEMEERVDKEIPYGYFQMWISTFHSFAEQILKEQIHHIGLSPNFKLMTEAETIIFLRKNLFLFDLDYFRPLGNPNKFLEGLINHFSRLKDEDISAEKYLKWAKSQPKNSEESKKYLELALAYQTYQQLKIKEGVFDFADLIYYLLEVFRKRKALLKIYQQKFKYILIDEFQDTNIAQYNLIKLLAPPKKNPKLTVVGDDSQAIYKFRGASVSNILNFMADYKNAKQITLIKNYRSNQVILDAAYKLIKNNDPDTLEAKLGISKKLMAVLGEKNLPKPIINLFIDEKVEQEADFVAQEILSLKNHYQYKDIAILCRANKHADPFIRALVSYGIPYQFLGPGQLLKQPEIKDLIAYLKVLYNLEDSVSLYRVLSMSIFDIDPKDISLLLTFSQKINQSLFIAIEIYLSFFDKNLYQEEFEIYKKYLPLLKKDSREKLTHLYNLIKKHLSLLKKDTAGQILYDFLEKTKYLNKLIAYKTEKEEKIALNISKFFSQLKNFEAEHEDASVFAVVDFLDMSLELGESPIIAKTDIESYNAVNIITAHSAKGLEFPVVFLVNLTKGRFPSRDQKEIIPLPDELIKEILPTGDYHLQEERRLFYVAMTRAKDILYFTASKFYGEGIRQQKLSPFVIEALGDDFINKYQLKKETEKKQLSIFDFKKNPESIPIKNNLNRQSFSYSQLETYEQCPLQYKYQYVLNIPTSYSAATSFGQTIHKTLQQFYQQFKTNPKIALDKLLKIYQKNWIPLGYSSTAHQKRMKKEGEKILKDFFEKFHHQNLKILDLEKPFIIKITPEIFIKGKIDRIDDIDGKQLEIIDYKTGKKPDEKSLKKDLQLSIYCLAMVENSKKSVDEINLSYYFLQNMEKITIKKTQEDLSLVKNEIIKKIEKINTHYFEPNVGTHCDFCPFRMICEAWR